MAIKIKGKDKGDLTGAPNRKAVKTNPVANARVSQAIAQSQNGFKGESLNDHGLPDGHKSRALIEPKRDSTTGPKDRSAGNKGLDKYPGGTKGIKIKGKC